MAKDNIRRIPFVLNLDDPVDAAIFEALDPMLPRHRASAFIRSALAYLLGVSSVPPVAMTRSGLALPSGDSALPFAAGRQKHEVRRSAEAAVPDEVTVADNQESVDVAARNFLNMFG